MCHPVVYTCNRFKKKSQAKVKIKVFLLNGAPECWGWPWWPRPAWRWSSRGSPWGSCSCPTATSPSPPVKFKVNIYFTLPLKFWRSSAPRSQHRVASGHDHDQNFGLACRQQSIPIDFWLNRPQQHDRDIVVWRPEFSTRPWFWGRLIDQGQLLLATLSENFLIISKARNRL